MHDAGAPRAAAILSGRPPGDPGGGALPGGRGGESGRGRGSDIYQGETAAGSGALPALWGSGRVIRGLRSRRFDLAIGMGRPCSRSTAWLAYATGAPWRLGYRSPALHPFPFFLNLGREPGGPLPRGGQLLELLAAIGIPAAGREAHPDPGPGGAKRRVAAAGSGRRQGGRAAGHRPHQQPEGNEPMAPSGVRRGGGFPPRPDGPPGRPLLGAGGCGESSIPRR